MDVFDGEGPARRISTPAGRRLSMIIESTQARHSKSPAAGKISITSRRSTYCNDPSHRHVGPAQHGHNDLKEPGVSILTGEKLSTPRESIEARTPNGSVLSVSVWSDKDADKFGHIRHAASGGGWRSWSRKRITIILAILLALVIAVAVGLAVGLKKNASSSDSPSLPTDNQPSTTTGAGAEADQSSTPTPGFPAGSYSFVTFLDTVQSSCTANSATWSCPPATDYYSDPQKALTILNWEISGSAGAYKISSKGQDPTFGTMFQNEKLELLDRGKDTERYRFQITRTRSVNMTGRIGEQQGDFTCDYGSTNVQGSLYTKMARTYPQDTIAVGNTESPAWPHAVRVEQTVAGGENVPSCNKSSGEKVLDGLEAQDPGTLCSCLYKNWTPAKPGS
ncbi:hypothetical protein BDU57DRAFT_588669 [Ampelomyces quisqualis]|uniref:Tat pathway signal sequence n=1 Tax=Ampelomyces quisqualis TaxID=50730 RepID=A0A6A5QHM8_AMPQU|nr:hypothetical protein BDU57DRAFT_588669 [Ampelomyces quisqualis]